MLRPISLALAAALCMAALTARGEGPPPQPPYSWRGIDGSGVFPAKDLVTSFYDLAPDMVTSAKDSSGRERTLALPGKPGEKRNIVWRTTLPFWGQNAPVVVKDRVFLMCEEGWKDDAPVLLCISVKDGAILWKQPVDHMDAWPEEKAKTGKEMRAKEHARWRLAMTWWNKLYWNNEKNGWANYTPEQVAPLAEAARKEGVTLKPAYTTGADGKQVVLRPGGVSGGWRGRYGLSNNNVGVDGQDDIYNTCNKNRYYWYTGWTSEGPYFGMTMGSVVSDGAHVYAVTGLDAAACFALDGTRLWVTDLDGQAVVGYPASAPGIIQNHIAAPVLADGKLIYYHRDGAVMYGLDAKTGKVAWKTESPKTPDAYRDWAYLKGQKPTGYQGHMGPGGTPVVLRLGDTTVVVSGQGMVVRVADGALLGQVKIPKGTPVGKGKAVEPAEADQYGCSYASWVGHGDCIYFITDQGLYAARLRIDGEALGQELLWRFEGAGGFEGPNLVYAGDRLYASVSQDKRRGITAITPATGKVEVWGPFSAGHDTALAFGEKTAVWPTGYIGDRTEGKSDPATTPGHGMTTYTIVSLPDLKSLGSGYLCPEAPAGEIAERHIARIGTARAVWGSAGITCWGNRIFVRNNDYLWCIGDPEKPFVAPE